MSFAPKYLYLQNMFGLNNWNIGIINYAFWTKPKDKWLKTKYSPSATANNTTSNSLSIGATWPDNPTAYAPMYLENGVTYNVSYDLNSIYTMAGTDTVECRIHLPSGSIVNQYTSTGTHSFSFMSTTTGWVDIEYAYLTDQDSMYTFWMPSIEIDNVLVSRELENEDFSSYNTGAFLTLIGTNSVLSASTGSLEIRTDVPFRAAAERLIPVTAGDKYTIDFDIANVHNMNQMPYNVRIRVEMAGYPTQQYTYLGNYFSIPTIYVDVPAGFTGSDIRLEISANMYSATQTLGAYIEIDNFVVKHWESVTTTSYNTICYDNGLGYRYSFNGKETDSETGLQDYGFRIYNPSLGKFLSVDPLADEYPYYTPYQFAGDMPIWAIDLDGLEPAAANFSFSTSSNSICKLPAYMNLPLCSNSSKDNTANNTPRLNNEYVNAQEIFINQKKTFDQAYNNAAGSVKYTNVSKKTNNYSDNCVVNTPRYEINDTRNLRGGINFLLDNKRPFYTGPLPEAPPRLASLVPFVGTKMQNDFNDQLRSLDINAPANSGYLGDFLAVIPITKIAGLGFAAKGGSRVFEVGSYNTLKGVEAGLEAHHVGQRALMKNFVPGYNANTAPSILVPKQGHTLGSGVLSRGTSSFSNARQVLARDIFELRRVYPNVPNSSLQQLIQMNKTMYPGAFIK
jgi:RHS repeat-associated protein